MSSPCGKSTTSHSDGACCDHFGGSATQHKWQCCNIQKQDTPWSTRYPDSPLCEYLRVDRAFNVLQGPLKVPSTIPSTDTLVTLSQYITVIRVGIAAPAPQITSARLLCIRPNKQVSQQRPIKTVGRNGQELASCVCHCDDITEPVHGRGGV
jgi:hypothetical protein